MSNLTLEEAAKRAGGEVVSTSDFGVPESPEVQESYQETMGDIATVLPQSMLLEHADEVLEQVSPDLATDYREAVKAARERSPYATTLGELFTPDVMNLLGPAGLARKVGKFGKVLETISKGKGIKGSVAQDVITSAGMQHGVEGEVDPLTTGMSVVAGQAMRAVPRALGKDPKGTRAEYTGMTKQKDIIKSKLTGDNSAKEVLDSMMDVMDKEHGMFTSGRTEFNPDTLKFETGKMDKLKSAVVAPSERELLSRSHKAKKVIWEKIKDFEKDLKGVFTKEDLARHGFHEIAGEISTLTESEQRAAHRLMDGVFEDLFPAGSPKTSSEKVLMAKRKLYDRIDYLKEGSNSYLIPARKKIARVLNSMIEELAGDEKYTKLNQKYGEFADLNTALKSRDLLKSTTADKVFDPSTYGTGMKYGALNFFKDKMTDIQKPFSQMGAAMEQVPYLQEAIQTPVRKGAAELMIDRRNENEPRREPQGFLSPQERMDMNLPKQLINSRLPRTTQGIQENSQLLKMKVAQQAEGMIRRQMTGAGVDPATVNPEEVTAAARELYKNVSTIVDERPEEIGSMLPVWIKMAPELFETDRYNRIDGVVPMSMQPMAREEIRKNSRIGNVERIEQLDLLNRTGEYSNN